MVAHSHWLIAQTFIMMLNKYQISFIRGIKQDLSIILKSLGSCIKLHCIEG